jgi:3-hydroxybutyryl-CoA dehydrogenase
MRPPIQTVAVVGSGTLGSVLASAAAVSGLRVVAIEAGRAGLDAARSRIAGLLEQAGDGAAGGAGGEIDYAVSLAAAADADLVVEALPERFGLKCDVLRRADALCRADAVFATTTTALSAERIGRCAGRAAQTVGLHPAGPNLGAKALEVIFTGETAPWVRQRILDFIPLLGQTAVVLDDQPGHVSGALLLGYLNSAVRMSEDGYAPREAIDTAMTLGCGLASGPFAQLDAIGLDTALDALSALYERTRERIYQPAATLHRLVEVGRLGRKTGAGFYDYGKPDAGIPGAASSSVAGGSPPSPHVIRRVGVVGSGMMATGIAEVCARGGYPVHLVARAEDKAERARMAVGRSLERAVARGRLSERDGDAAAGRLTVGARLADLASCDLVIEAIAEDLPAKKRVFAELDMLCTSAALLATTTSSLPVTECAEVSVHPGRVVAGRLARSREVGRRVGRRATRPRPTCTP